MYNGDLISREQAIEEIKSVFEWHDVVTVDRLVEHIKALQSQQKTGKWTKETKHYKDQFQEFNYYTIKCSVCGSAPEKNWHLTNYCPNCGSRMLEEGEEE